MQTFESDELEEEVVVESKEIEISVNPEDNSFIRDQGRRGQPCQG